VKTTPWFVAALFTARVVLAQQADPQIQEWKTPESSVKPAPPASSSTDPKKDEQTKDEQKKEPVKKDEKKADQKEPELNLPIRYFVYTALLSGLGYATGLLVAGPERALRDPSKHGTISSTNNLYNAVYYGGAISRGFYGASGAMGGYASFKLQGAIREYITAKANAAMARRPADPRRETVALRAPEAAPFQVEAALPEQEQADGPLTITAEREAEQPVPVAFGFTASPNGEGALFFSVEF
jgi:hypothetical protein